MAKNYTYIKKDGTEGTVSASSPEEATRIAVDRAPKSGVQEERSLPSLDETGKPADTELPADSPSKLLTFVQATQRATALARQARNKTALATTGKAYPEGILPNFGSILGELNNASDSFAEDLTTQLDDALKGDEAKYEMRTVGRQLIQFELGPNGEVLGQKVIATAPKESSGDTVDFFNDTAQRDLAQGRLTGADPTVQVIFTRAPQDFRDSWVRNNVGTDNSTVSANALLQDLESWEKLQDEKKTGAVVNPFAAK